MGDDGIDSRLVWLPHEEARPRLSKLSLDENAVLKLAIVDELLRRERKSMLVLLLRIGKASVAIVGSIVGAMRVLTLNARDVPFSTGGFSGAGAGALISMTRSCGGAG